METGVKTATNERAIYLYAITPSTNSLRVLAVPGVDGLAPVEAIPCGRFVCWFSLVDSTEFGENLQNHMEDLDWLASASVRHQQTVAEVAAKSDALPARFGTVFLSVDSLLSHVREQQQGIAAALKRISGCEEWGIKVFGVQTSFVEKKDNPKSGAEYLKRKAGLMTEGRSQGSDPDIKALINALKLLSKESAPTGKVSASQPGLRWQGAFLVPRENRRKLQETLERFAAKWSAKKRIDCSGPWPPYSFVSVDAP